LYMYYDDKKASKSYGWSWDDFLNTTAAQRKKLKEIVDGHQAGLLNIDKRYKMTPADIALLMPIKDLINNNDLFKYLKIGIPYEQPTKLGTVKDRLLLAIPLFIVSGIIPHTLYNTIDGKLQGILAIGASYVSGAAIGNWGFPLFDAWTSSALFIYKIFGHNRVSFEKALPFALVSTFHFIMNSIAQKFLSIPTLSFQIIGVTLQSLRALSYMMGIIDMREFFGHNKTWMGLFADKFHLDKHENPLIRRNADDKSYTLIDLLNAQPIQEK